MLSLYAPCANITSKAQIASSKDKAANTTGFRQIILKSLLYFKINIVTSKIRQPYSPKINAKIFSEHNLLNSTTNRAGSLNFCRI